MANRFNPQKLSRQLAPFGFTLNLPEAMKGGISFVRPSSVERLFEHVLICAGKIVWAEAVVSAATYTTCNKSVSEEDRRFRLLLAPDWPHTTSLETRDTAQPWLRQLIDNADTYCKQMAAEIGPALAARLQPVFKAVDSYTQKLGDIFAILDREFAFVSEISPDERAEFNRLTSIAQRYLWLNANDSEVASIALVRFGNEVEECESTSLDKVHQGDGLTARLILLADYVRAKRLAYEKLGGLRR